MKFRVTVLRDLTESKTILVDADSASEALELAPDLAFDATDHIEWETGTYGSKTFTDQDPSDLELVSFSRLPSL